MTSSFNCHFMTHFIQEEVTREEIVGPEIEI